MLRRLRRHYPSLLREPTIAAQALMAVAVTTADLVFYRSGLEQTSLGRVVADPLEIVWAAATWLGGFLVLRALLWPRRGDDAMLGLGLLGASFIVDSVAVFVYRGLGAGSITGGILLALGLSFIARAAILRSERLAKLEALHDVMAFVAEEKRQKSEEP